MTLARIALAVLALVWGGALAAEGAATSLLERAQLWSERGRDDLARESIETALRLDSRNPDALLALGRLQLRANQDRDAAATLGRLREASPGHRGVAELEALIRIRGPDRDRMRQARQLARAGRDDEAADAYRALFPQGMPDDEISLEYAQVLGGTTGGWERARVELAALARRHPLDARYQVAFHAHVSTHKPVDAATLHALRELAKDPSVAVSRPALEAWRHAVLAMDTAEASVPFLREYVAANPGETAVSERLREVERITGDPALRAKRAGLAAFEAGRLEEAGARLEEAIRYAPNDSEALGTLGIVRLREERHGDAAPLFERAALGDAPGRAKWERLARTARYWAGVHDAKLARESGRLEEAEARAREALALDPAEGQAGAELARVLHARAKAEQAAGHADAALAAYESAAALAPRDPWLRLDLARMYAARGDTARGEALFREPASPESDASFALAIYLSGLGRESDALRALERIPAPDRSDAMVQMQRRLWSSVQSQRLRALEEAGRDAEAAKLIEEMRAAAVDDAGLAAEVARAEAATAMRRARALRESGRERDAIALYRTRVAADGADREASLALIDTLLDVGDTGEAHALVDAALKASPDDARVLSQAGRLAIAEGRVDDAVDYEQRAMALAPRDDEGWRYRRLAGLIDRRLAWIGAGVEALHRAGTPGKSQLDSQELPMGARQGWTAAGEWSVHATPSRVASGDLDRSNSFELPRFATELLCLPACASAPVSSVERGVAIGAGYERGAWRFDLGTSPIGFPVVNVVGSVATHGEWGPVGYTLEAARRPVASSLLSYAGVRDPNTGRTWGGVVTSGVRANFSRDSGGEYGAWGVLGLYSLTGRNVRDNTQAELMAGGYRRIVNETDRLLTAGLTGMLWRFRDDAGEYTFGHGGYYSPRSYRSLAFPVSFAMRSDLASFAVRASVSVAWSTAARAPFFPTDPTLQAQAEALAPSSGIDPFYPGGNNGRSYGRSFEAAAERQVGPGTFVGVRLDIERSTNYTPSRLLLYVRLTPGGAAARPVSLPPEPGLPGWRN